MASVTAIPQEALEWLVGPERSSILLIGAAGGYAGLLARAGHSVTVADPDPVALRRAAGEGPNIHIVGATAEALPFDPCCFSTILAIQNFHTFAPGLALGEWARVLSPGGQVGLSYLIRDDSVPWVKKLRTIVQSDLPEAMSSGQEVESVAAIDASIFFPHVEKTSFRLWSPSTRAQLQDAAGHATGADTLDTTRRRAMVEAVGQLYDEYARVPEPLLLPYRIHCWRAQVDQSMVAGSLVAGDVGLSITL